MIRGKSETAIQAEVLVGVTALPDVMAWRENSGFAWVGEEMRVRVGQTVRVTADMKILTNARPLRAGTPGIGDIMGSARGRAIALEVKDEEGRQEVSQQRFQQAFERAGGAYSIVRSADEAIDFLRRTVLG
jgi:hypothetical protein